MKESTVPTINLAPKLRRDLSLWNPFDYLLLLYWVFYFPQAVRWYVETRDGGDNHPVQLRLRIQGLLLTVITPLIICSIAANLGLSVDWVGVVWGVVWGVALGVALGVVWGVALGVVWGVALGVVFIFAFFRLDNWLIGLLAGSQGRLFPRITLLPLPGLTSTLQQWLQQDWETAINNLNQYLRYSRQFIPVLAAVNRVLPQFPEAEIIYRVSRLAENPSDWQLLKYASAKPFSLRDSQIRLDTPARAAAAGFWYLHQQDTEKAEKAFAVVRSLAYGEEMYSLAQTLHRFSQAATPDSIASLEVAPIAAEPSLRPQTWQAISSLNRVIAEIALAQRSDSRKTRKLALNRIIRELRDIIDRQAANLPLAEKALILSIAQKWKTCL